MNPHTVTALALLALGCSSSSSRPDLHDAAGPAAEVSCSIRDRTIRCDRRFDPMVDASDAYEHTALHLVLAEPLEDRLAFEGTMDFVWVFFHQVWALESSDPRIEGFDPPGIFDEAQFLQAGIEEGVTRIAVSGELTPEADGCVGIELTVSAESSSGHDWGGLACP